MNCARCGKPRGLSVCFISPDLCLTCDSEPRSRDAWDYWLEWASLLILAAIILKAAIS